MGDDGDDGDDLQRRIDDLLERAEAGLETLASESATAADADEALDDLVDVADEAEDLLATVDLWEVLRGIDWQEAPEAVEAEDLPEAIAESDASEAVALRDLLRLIDLPDLWENVNAREFWREKRELDDEVGDLLDEEDDDASGDDDGGVGIDVSAPDAGGEHDYDPESMENAVQAEVSDAVGEFREEIVAAHDRLAELRAENQRRFSERRRNRSRNPTAVSTLPGADRGSAARFSTVPEETLHSTAPNRERIYGPRFDDREGDDE